MSMESQRYAYLLEDVMRNKFTRGFNPVDLWKLAEKKKTITYKMDDVKHWVYNPCWSFGIPNGECFYSIYQVLLQKGKFADDIKRIKKADTSYPLIIIEDDFDKYGGILDGNHRFAKLILNGARKIKIKYFTKTELKKIMIKL